jgi:hypothetical protein
MHEHWLSRTMRQDQEISNQKIAVDDEILFYKESATKAMKPDGGFGLYLYTVKKVAHPHLPMYSG